MLADGRVGRVGQARMDQADRRLVERVGRKDGSGGRRVGSASPNHPGKIDRGIPIIMINSYILIRSNKGAWAPMGRLSRPSKLMNFNI